ncbi:MAG: glycoside hydrolase family 16 protein, partial [Eudoraea sp.]
SDDFHLYSMEWTASGITFLVDNVEFGTIANDGTRPFDKDFFFILNVAMGGNLGGTIDPAFTQSTMEVDYIRVYK